MGNSFIKKMAGILSMFLVSSDFSNYVILIITPAVRYFIFVSCFSFKSHAQRHRCLDSGQAFILRVSKSVCDKKPPRFMILVLRISYFSQIRLLRMSTWVQNLTCYECPTLFKLRLRRSPTQFKI